jgi:hypothetical protein
MRAISSLDGKLSEESESRQYLKQISRDRPQMPKPAAKEGMIIQTKPLAKIPSSLE